MTDIIHDLSVLLEALEGTCLMKIRNFEIRQPIGEIREFGNALTELGTIHNCRKISEYGQKLTKAADNFDVEGILKLIKKYHDVVKSIRN
jgi:hypothetical protein